MNLLTGGLLGGGGSLLQGIMGMSNARDARQHQDNMAKKKYQWMMQDLEKAGLNPILMAGSGMGTPGAGGAQIGMPQIPNIGMDAMAGATSAQQIEESQTVVDKVEAETDIYIKELEIKGVILNQENQRFLQEKINTIIKGIQRDQERERLTQEQWKAKVAGLKKTGVDHIVKWIKSIPTVQGNIDLNAITQSLIDRIMASVGIEPWGTSPGSLSGTEFDAGVKKGPTAGGGGW